jgi:hypothetical protein
VFAVHLALILACGSLACCAGSKVALDIGVPAAAPAVIAKVANHTAAATITCNVMTAAKASLMCAQQLFEQEGEQCLEAACGLPCMLTLRHYNSASMSIPMSSLVAQLSCSSPQQKKA